MRLRIILRNVVIKMTKKNHGSQSQTTMSDADLNVLKDEYWDLIRTNQALQANILEDQAEVEQLLESAANKEELAERHTRYAREELHQANQYHPSLMTKQYIDNISSDTQQQYALNVRLLPPQLEWDDDQDVGTITFLYQGKDGVPEKFGYGISSGIFVDVRPGLLNEFINDLGKTIAERVLEAISQKIGKNEALRVKRSRSNIYNQS